jgi:hypothetical protein
LVEGAREGFPDVGIIVGGSVVGVVGDFVGVDVNLTVGDRLVGAFETWLGALDGARDTDGDFDGRGVEGDREGLLVVGLSDGFPVVG